MKRYRVIADPSSGHGGNYRVAVDGETFTRLLYRTEAEDMADRMNKLMEMTNESHNT